MILKKNNGILFLILLFFYSIISLHGQSIRLADPFELSQVKLLSSRFTENQNRDFAYLDLLDANRMLFTWHKNYGLSTLGSSSVGGWEGDGHELRGHTLGHILIALTQAYATSGDVKYKNKADYIIAELKKCQDASVSKGFSTGYLSAFPESYVNNLLASQHAWAPLYCIHKTFSGLLACYQLCGNTTALTIATNMGDWIYNKLKNYSHAQLQGFWNNMDWNAGEYGGFNESLAILYSITKNPNHLIAAKYFDHDALFSPCLNNQDQLNGMHANTQIPKIIGALKIYEVNGEANYFTIAKNFFNIVTGSHTYVTGGNSKGERFGSPGIIAGRLGGDNTETCNSYNMLKLAMYLFMNEPDARYMDFYENTLYNHILGSQDPVVNSNHVTYFVPLNAGGIKTYSDDYNTFSCCHGTGMENQTKYNAAIYFHKNNILWLNLFIASELSWTEKNFVIRQETKFPDEQNSKLTIIKGNGQFALKIRVPYWAKNGLTLFVNGIQQNVTAAPGSYATLDRMWTQGDVIQINLPFLFRIEYTPDVSNMGGIKYGPILLAGQNISSMPTLKLSSSNLSASFSPTADALEFTSNGITFKPFYNTHHINYSVYFYTNPIIPEQGCNKTPQTINFPAIPDKIISDAPFNITASASSGLPVSFSISTGPASMVNKTVTLNGTAGNVTVKASQAGDATFCPTEYPISFKVIDPNAGDGLTGNYFQDSYPFNITNNTWTNCNSVETGSWCPPSSGVSWFETPITSRTDATINIPKGTFSSFQYQIPGSNSSGPISIRWTGYILFPIAGTYTFYLSGADGLRLNINNKNIIGNFINNGENTDPAWLVRPYLEANSSYLPLTGTITVSTNDAQKKTPILIEFYSVGTTSWSSLNERGIKMEWENTNGSIQRQIVPQKYLFTSLTTGILILKNEEVNSLNTYPNPTDRNGFYIEFDPNNPTSESFIELLNLQGQVIERHQLSGSKKEFIHLYHDNSSGIYLLRYTNLTYTIYKKIIFL